MNAVFLCASRSNCFFIQIECAFQVFYICVSFLFYSISIHLIADRRKTHKKSNKWSCIVFIYQTFRFSIDDCFVSPFPSSFYLFIYETKNDSNSNTNTYALDQQSELNKSPQLIRSNNNKIQWKHIYNTKLRCNKNLIFFAVYLSQSIIVVWFDS